MGNYYNDKQLHKFEVNRREICIAKLKAFKKGVPEKYSFYKD